MPQKCISTLLGSSLFGPFRALRASLIFQPSHNTMGQDGLHIEKGQIHKQNHYSTEINK